MSGLCGASAGEKGVFVEGGGLECQLLFLPLGLF